MERDDKLPANLAGERKGEVKETDKDRRGSELLEAVFTRERPSTRIARLSLASSPTSAMPAAATWRGAEQEQEEQEDEKKRQEQEQRQQQTKAQGFWASAMDVLGFGDVSACGGGERSERDGQGAQAQKFASILMHRRRGSNERGKRVSFSGGGDGGDG